MENREELYNEYIVRTAEIRRLSTPSLEEIDNADDYSRKLRSNFTRIGELAEENRQFLNDVFFPLIKSNNMLSKEQIHELMGFGNELINSEVIESLDIPVMTMLSDRLFSDADNKRDLYSKIRSLDSLMDTYCELTRMTMRIRAYPAIQSHYRDTGFEIGYFFNDLLDKDKFLQIDDMECRRLVLKDALYSIAFFDGYHSDPDLNEEQLEQLEKMLSVAEDPFYKEAVPGFDWDNFTFRTLGYYAAATEQCNVCGFNKKQLDKISERSGQLMSFLEEKKNKLALSSGEEEYIRARYHRNLYLAGKASAAEYREKLLEIYRLRDAHDYSDGMAYLNLAVPLEYICLLDKNELTPKDRLILRDLYRNFTSYAFHLPNGGTMSTLLEYYAQIIDRFIEVSSGITFEEMIVNLLAAFHPPTYVHSVMVAQITECLCGHLIRLHPELLTGVLGAASPEEVTERRDEIINFAYHSGLCHDFGKLMIIDTVFVYGRKLFGMEFDLIRTHPKTGYELLSRYPSTKAYAEIALGHHKWYDNSKGYPESFDTSKSSVKTIIDLVTCADCLDAATDTVGRSYKKGKSIEEFIDEIKAGSGTHYAPWLPELLTDPKTSEDIGYMLRESRQNNYRDTYYLLCSMNERKI